jgi:hypothetical protein
MASHTYVLGRIGWSMSRDEEGHRTYKLKWLARATSYDDGPSHALVATGLPAVGAHWQQGNDVDTWAKCLPTQSCRFVEKNEKGWHWEIEQTFSTKGGKKCQTETIGSPLDEPMTISGGFSKYTEEVSKDKDDKRIMSSSHELFRGAMVEFDSNRPTVSIGMNLLNLPLSTFAPMVDTVNDATLWGLPKRCVKLTNVSWSREMYGICTFYYTVNYEFDCRYDTFDRKVYDEGTKILNLKEMPNADKDEPAHFTRYKDVNGDYSRVFLDGEGSPIKKGDDPVEIDIEYYSESSFSSLGIPTSL